MVNLIGNTRYGGISVTSQYLREDKSRSGLTRLKNASRERDDSGFVCRVRGSPHKGFYLERIYQEKLNAYKNNNKV